MAAPLAAVADEPWLRGLDAGGGLRLHLLSASEAAPRGALDRGLEDLLRVADLPRTAWLLRAAGAPEDVAYVLDVVGEAHPAGGSAAVAVLGRDPGRAATALVDAAAGSRGDVLALQVEEARAAMVAALLRSGDVAAAMPGARLALLRRGGEAWAVAAVRAGEEPALLGRVATLAAQPVPLPALSRRAARRPSRQAEMLARLRGRASLPASLRSPARLAPATAALLIAAVSAGAAGWVVLHRAQRGLVQPAVPVVQQPSSFPPAPPPRTGSMVATWDRTAQVILFGGASPSGAGHGTPLNDTWRGALPPAGPWQRVAPEPEQPTARLAGGMAADTADGYVLLFGGEGPNDVGLADTWTYAGGWSQLSPRTSPPAGPALAATDPSTGHVLLVTTCCALAAIPTGERMQTWRWSGADWVLLGPAPGWVTTAALVADTWDGTVVMLADGGDHRGATFIWDGSAWTAAPSPVEPPLTPGVRPALTYDSATHRVLDVVTGEDGVHHTWTFDGHTWVERAPAGGPPVIGLVLRDPIDGRAVLYGGGSADDEFDQRWFWADGVWDESLELPAPPLVPSAGYGMAVAGDPGAGGLVAYGGDGAFDQTWVWSGSSWSQAFFTAPAPPARLGASMAYDPRSRTTYLVGGRLVDGAAARDMWAWRGSEWARVAVSGLPPPTSGAPMVWDRARGEAVLLAPDEESAAVLPGAATWVFDGIAWTRRSAAVSPPWRDGSQLSFDPATGEVLLVLPCCPGAAEQRSETWTWDGSNWQRRQTLHNPPIHAAITEDGFHDRLVLVAACCGGFDDAGSVGPPQTWTWDGHDWTRTAARLPALQDVAALAVDARGDPLLVGRIAGAGPRHPLDGLWRWDGAAWQRLV